MNYTKLRNHLFSKLRLRLVLFFLVPVLIFTAPAVTLHENIEASSGPTVPENSVTATTANPLQTPCSPENATKGAFDPQVINLPTVPVHLSVLPNGKVLFWGRDKTIEVSGVKEAVGKSNTYVWNIPDGSNKTDVAIWRPSEGNWYIINSSTGAYRINQWGLPGDIPVPGDYDGDGRADLAVWRPSEGNWYLINSSTGAYRINQWGLPGDIPVPADYDGDGTSDLAVFRPSEGKWYIIKSLDGAVFVRQFGQNGDVPVPKDYDGDYKADLAFYRTSDSKWYIVNSKDQLERFPLALGMPGDVPVPGDYYGDEYADLAVYRPSNGNWIIENLPKGGGSGTPISFMTPAPGDRPVPGDYDGDGKMDIAIHRASDEKWYIKNISTNQTMLRMWGVGSDILVPADYDGIRRVVNKDTNLFCSGHSFLPDGRLFVAGGHGHPAADGVGERETNIFNYANDSWSPGPLMNLGRWYPFNVTLNTGEPLIMSGAYWSNEPTTPVETAMNLVPQVTNVNGTSLKSLTSASYFTLYPHLHLMPNGKVLQLGADFFEPGQPSIDHASRAFDPNANNGLGSWESFATGGTTFPHARGTSVLFDSGRQVLMVGGFDINSTPTKAAEFINLKPPAGQSSIWTSAQPMTSPRAFHTATVLPNGKVLVSGGVICSGGNNVKSVNCSGAAMNPELWNLAIPSVPLGQIPSVNSPGTAPWITMAKQKEVRAYHSVAALLPDGKVLVGGGGLPGAIGEVTVFGDGITDINDDASRFGHKNVEIYSPPYLFDSDGCGASRPTISFAPLSISYGQTFFVGTSDVGSNPQVSLVRLPSVTHAFNQDQRQVFLAVTQNGSTGLNVTAPADSNKVPPGYYMLFVLNSSGVPSVARFIKVDTTPVFEGFVDGTDCNQVWGWAWNRSKPNHPITVSIFAGSTFLANVVASGFRQDLLNADKGNGKHAFVFNIPDSIKNGQTQAISVRIAGTSTNLGSSPRSITCRASLFPTEAPQTTAGGGGSTWEQGIEFSSSVAGKITHIRFWKAPGETGSHIGRIWTSSGVLLASASFVNETSFGWQVAQLSTPLQIQPGVRYRVAYNINNVVAKTFNVLNMPITRGPLTGWLSYFSSPAGSFPTAGTTSNLFADVIFNSPQ